MVLLAYVPATTDVLRNFASAGCEELWEFELMTLVISDVAACASMLLGGYLCDVGCMPYRWFNSDARVAGCWDLAVLPWVPMLTGGQVNFSVGIALAVLVLSRLSCLLR